MSTCCLLASTIVNAAQGTRAVFAYGCIVTLDYRGRGIYSTLVFETKNPHC